MTAPDLSPAAVERIADALMRRPDLPSSVGANALAAATLRALVKANRERDLRLFLYGWNECHRCENSAVGIEDWPSAAQGVTAFEAAEKERT